MKSVIIKDVCVMCMYVYPGPFNLMPNRQKTLSKSLGVPVKVNTKDEV